MSEPQELPELSNLEKEIYSWQTTVEGFEKKVSENSRTPVL